jgi:hypothetical protein
LEERDEFFVDEAERLADAEERLNKGPSVAEPWGPVGTFADHPIATGLAAADAPFVNGRAVVADEPATAGAVAFIP